MDILKEASFSDSTWEANEFVSKRLNLQAMVNGDRLLKVKKKKLD